jgi:hypothetical protein
LIILRGLISHGTAPILALDEEFLAHPLS